MDPKKPRLDDPEFNTAKLSLLPFRRRRAAAKRNPHDTCHVVTTHPSPLSTTTFPTTATSTSEAPIAITTRIIHFVFARHITKHASPPLFPSHYCSWKSPNIFQPNCHHQFRTSATHIRLRLTIHVVICLLQRKPRPLNLNDIHIPFTATHTTAHNIHSPDGRHHYTSSSTSHSFTSDTNRLIIYTSS